jgi:hypothetical protein
MFSENECHHKFGFTNASSMLHDDCESVSWVRRKARRKDIRELKRRVFALGAACGVDRVTVTDSHHKRLYSHQRQNTQKNRTRTSVARFVSEMSFKRVKKA